MRSKKLWLVVLACVLLIFPVVVVFNLISTTYKRSAYLKKVESTYNRYLDSRSPVGEKYTLVENSPPAEECDRSSAGFSSTKSCSISAKITYIMGNHLTDVTNNVKDIVRKELASQPSTKISCNNGMVTTTALDEAMKRCGILNDIERSRISYFSLINKNTSTYFDLKYAGLSISINSDQTVRCDVMLWDFCPGYDSSKDKSPIPGL